MYMYMYIFKCYRKSRSKTRCGLPLKNDQKDVPACKVQVFGISYH